VSVQVRILERDRTFTPLGIRFWDAALDLPIAETLVVFAWLRGASYPPVRAVRSPGGVYAFHHLPGQAAAEKPAADEDHPESLGTPREYAIAVDDPSGRYQPAAFSVTLPLGYRGVFPAAPAASPPGAAGKAYLFHTAARPAPPGLAAIRADLVDDATLEPAAWAVLTAAVAGETRSAIADARGRVLVLIPFPTPERMRQGSPPVDPQAASWPITLSVRWEPAALRFPFPARGELDPAWAERPSLKSILDEQAPARIRTHQGDPLATEWTTTLVHGRELVLRTVLAGGADAATVRISAGPFVP
jgi:hypothetical protein